MAVVLLFASCLMYSLTNCVYSAPSQINTHEGAVVIPVTTIPELGTVDDTHSVTISSSSSKISGNGSNDNSQKTSSVTTDAVEKGGQSSVNAKNDAVDVPVVMKPRTAGAKSNVMVLTDDVITDALFTNIDTMQDHLEVCEEGLRQQLRLHSHGRILQDTAGDDGDFPTDRVGRPRSGKDKTESYDSKKDIQVDAVNEEFEDNDIDDYDSDAEEGDINNDTAGTENENDNDRHSSEMTTDSASNSSQGHARQRRSVAGGNRHGQLSRRADILAQKVVQRLSARLEYIRQSLFQCHLLYKQFGQL